MEFIDKLKRGIQSGTPDETEACGAELASLIPSNAAIALSGDLGTGKTTFVRGLARGMGLRATVTSPTYNIYTFYNGTRQLLHMDAYRLSGASDLENLSLEEFLQPPFLIAVEWPEKIASFFEEYPTYWIIFDILENKRHSIRLKEISSVAT